ncbi:MAG: response regulator, partial [Dehalococcoidia bacterium]|nr:response regulator [Dehalococcoidia bacterium]
MVSVAERILVVDDEPTARRLVRRTLSFEGYRCDEADSAENALRKLLEEPTGLVVLDVRMPGKNGDELLPEIRAKHPDTAVIMVTATVDPDTIVRCMKAGA